MFTLRLLDTGEAVPFEGRHAVTARKTATRVARDTGERVAVIRADKIAYVVQPDGSVTRPPGTVAGAPLENCTRESGKPCFCTACRAERRRA